jgi:G3E family GTPase
MRNKIIKISLIVLPAAALLLMLHFFYVSNQKNEEIEQLMTEYVSLDSSEELAKTFVSIVETYEEQTDKLIDSVQHIEREKMRQEMARQARIILNQQISIRDTIIINHCDTLQNKYDSVRAVLNRIDTRLLQQ